MEEKDFDLFDFYNKKIEVDGFTYSNFIKVGENAVCSCINASLKLLMQETLYIPGKINICGIEVRVRVEESLFRETNLEVTTIKFGEGIINLSTRVLWPFVNLEYLYLPSTIETIGSFFLPTTKSFKDVIFESTENLRQLHFPDFCKKQNYFNPKEKFIAQKEFKEIVAENVPNKVWRIGKCLFYEENDETACTGDRYIKVPEGVEFVNFVFLNSPKDTYRISLSDSVKNFTIRSKNLNNENEEFRKRPSFEILVKNLDLWFKIEVDIIHTTFSLYCGDSFHPDNLLKDLVVSFPQKKVNQKNNIALRSVVFEDKLTYITSGSFRGCKNLEYVKFPKTLDMIEYDAFSGCSRMSEFVFPKSIKEYIFLDKNSLFTEKFCNDTVIFTIYRFEKDIIHHIIESKNLEDFILYLNFDENTPEIELIDTLCDLAEICKPGKLRILLSKAFSKLTYSVLRFTRELVFYINSVHQNTFKNSTVFSKINLRLWDRRHGRVSVTKIGDRYITTPNLTGNLENNYIGEIIIPDKIDNCPVDLGFGTFFNCKYLDKVILPERMRDQVEQGFIETNNININIEFYD